MGTRFVPPTTAPSPSDCPRGDIAFLRFIVRFLIIRILTIRILIIFADRQEPRVASGIGERRQPSRNFFSIADARLRRRPRPEYIPPLLGAEDGRTACTGSASISAAPSRISR